MNRLNVLAQTLEMANGNLESALNVFHQIALMPPMDELELHCKAGVKCLEETQAVLKEIEQKLRELALEAGA